MFNSLKKELINNFNFPLVSCSVITSGIVCMQQNTLARLQGPTVSVFQLTMVIFGSVSSYLNYVVNVGGL